jgi:hypothetical protein
MFHKSGGLFVSENQTNPRDAACSQVKHIKSVHIITIQSVKAWTAQKVIRFEHFDSLDSTDRIWV